MGRRDHRGLFTDDTSPPELLPAAARAYLASLDALLRARTEEQFSDADEGMSRSMNLICEATGITPQRMPRASGTSAILGRLDR